MLSSSLPSTAMAERRAAIPRWKAEGCHEQRAHNRKRTYPEPQHHGKPDQQLCYRHGIRRRHRVLQSRAQTWLIGGHRAFLYISGDVFLIATVGKFPAHKLVLRKEQKHNAYHDSCYRHGYRRRTSIFHADRFFSLKLLISRWIFFASLAIPLHGLYCLNTLPSFITKFTFLSASTLASGSPFTATTSANAPGAITPISPFISSRLAAVEVADLMASMGLMPNFTIKPNSFAIGSVQGMPPMSVPKAIFTPAFMAFLKETSCSLARARSRLPSSVFSGDQSV